MASKKKPKWRKGGRVYVPSDGEDRGPSWLAILIFTLIIPCWPIAVILGYKKISALWRQRKTVEYRNYAAIIGDHSQVSIRELAAKMDKTPALVMMDLQDMIGKGYMGDNAYIDKGRGILILDATEVHFVDEEPADKAANEAAKAPETAQKHSVRFEEVVRPQYNAENIRESAQSVQTGGVRSDVRAQSRAGGNTVFRNDAYESTLRQIRDLNERIEDPKVSASIDHLGELTAGIFAVVRQKPEQEDEVRKFMNYYLPTTFKLLESYALMEKQSYQGENIAVSRKKIEDILQTLVKGFEQLQDRLFRMDAMDVDAEIRVLETMLASDGLVTDGKLDLKSVAAEQGISLTLGDR